ncbi:XTP/dITP diphosphohydrolase [Methylomarinovum caldicuralii]|uniref:dITP/XTP pyrophosphatase n=1 Tax=Methylomarinovum caldicuralii TaxID=438856 RepID=A0AAU9CRY9_9GAMM|nr:RdgB/HAM1 family non-canonical purine NTP pyrophosphatase [Methylomarinovum caldicuralii]BCX80662.1 XTP/dITP diphosphohydrolase [Methylomarinovum caldicuralii]
MSAVRLVLASGNRGKLREIQALLSPHGVRVLPQTAFAVAEAKETAPTFVENALIKARNAARYTGLPALADDSGLEVAALAGAPGVHSARYAGPDADDRLNNAKLLEALAEFQGEERRARFRCVLVLVRHPFDPSPLIAEGTWEGRIAEAPRGEGGFGYDPLFWLPDRGCTAAELPPEEKNRLSHRGQALRQLLARWPAL